MMVMMLNNQFQRNVRSVAPMPFNRDISNTTVANGDIVIDKAHPVEIESANNVGSAGRTSKPQRKSMILFLAN